MQKKWAKQTGFTLVELLIVIVVIAILAAISIVAYNGIQNRAHDSAIKSDLAVVQKKMEMSRVDIGHYPSVYAELPTDIKLSTGAYANRNNAYLCVDTVADAYAFGVASKSGKYFSLTSRNGISEQSNITANLTCSHIGKAWEDAGIFKRQFYSDTSGAWAVPWGS